MGICASCGNEYDNTFTVEKDGERFEFDSFQCAIHKLAPTCKRCDARIIGPGVQKGETIYCCAHCADKSGDSGLVDRV